MIKQKCKLEMKYVTHDECVKSLLHCKSYMGANPNYFFNYVGIQIELLYISATLIWMQIQMKIDWTHKWSINRHYHKACDFKIQILLSFIQPIGITIKHWKKIHVFQSITKYKVKIVHVTKQRMTGTGGEETSKLHQPSC